MHFQTIRTVRYISRYDRATIATCSLRTPTDRLKENTSIDDFCPFPDFLYFYVMLSIFRSILVCAAASLFCACLVSVLISAPYCIADSTQELYTCLFRQMARLLVNISRCLAYPNIDHFNINKNPRQILFALLESSLLEPSKRICYLLYNYMA